MKMNRAWSMPNKNTFTIKPIKELIEIYIGELKDKNPNAIIIDPFANQSKLADITNDLALRKEASPFQWWDEFS